MEATIIDQINKLLMNRLVFEFEIRKLGSTRINTTIKKIAGIISFIPIFNYSKNF